VAKAGETNRAAICGKQKPLAVATAAQLLRKGFNMYYMRWIQDALRLKANINEPEAYERLIEPTRKKQVL